MNSKAWKLSKTAVSGTLWAPPTPLGGISVVDLSERRRGAVVGVPDRAGEILPLHSRHPVPLENQRLKGKILAFLKSVLGKLIISPSFLLSSLLVFLLVPDSVLKGTCSIDLKTWSRGLFRRFFDIVSSTIGLILTAPLFLILPILIKLDSSGSVIYKQIRVGQNRRNKDRRRSSYSLKGDRRKNDRREEDTNGRLFEVYKFRSMCQDAEKKSGPVWAKQGDPRITKVGKLLRATRTDEIPQLINIFKGDMSLVGPRPERPYFVNRFVVTVSRYQERLKVKPGLTGLAQVMGGYDTSLEDVYAKLDYDLNYLSHQSFGHDLKILLKTFAVVLCGKGVY